MKKSREEVQKEALNKIKENNYTGIICLDPGSGKSKVAIEAIKQGNFKNILITSPRTNLKKNWKEELDKWCEYAPGHRFYGDLEYSYWYKGLNNDFRVQLSNVQTCYKWQSDDLKKFDLIIADEIHTFGTEYFNLIINSLWNSISILGLTGTPTKSDPWKKEVLYKALPIIYEYYNAESDGITNSIKYWCYEYDLNDNYKVIAGTKAKKWYVGEAKQYQYLSDQYDKAKTLMYLQGAENYFEQSLEWMNGKTATKEQKEAGRKFFYAVRNRKEFLWGLESSLAIAISFKNKILYPTWKNPSKNKVLLFSEFTQQAERLSKYSIHSNNGKNAKEAEIINKELLDKFNKGEIRELSSCLSLTLGLNMVGANWAIVKSFSSSNTNFIQKCKRLARLNPKDVANVLVIVPKNTQAVSWRDEMMKGIEYTVINNLNELNI